MPEVKTVRIHLPHESGEWATINAADFDPAEHVLFDPLPKQEQIQDDVSRETAERDSVTERDTSRFVTDVTPAPRKRGRPRKDDRK